MRCSWCWRQEICAGQLLSVVRKGRARGCASRRAGHCAELRQDEPAGSLSRWLAPLQPRLLEADARQLELALGADHAARLLLDPPLPGDGHLVVTERAAVVDRVP